MTETLTGQIQFDPLTGFRTNFSATVIEIRPGVNSLTSIKEVKPFVMLRRSNPGEPEPKGNDRFEGYCIDLLKLLAKNISGFEYDIFVSDGNKYGARQADGSWDGMLGYLLNETADVAVAPLTITQERERAVDFSKPFMTTGLYKMLNTYLIIE
ncbi:Glutathione reductase (GR) (GRase) [Parelaphostrongylus tenuis]|uniref:Glutathione reductase (GR) (GRase) n=1 Tax=Parelaphostrongylus tenuis TaxID=148309 RepID=A0AAD5MI88_PARTN|nr:Glutathione reductase (GR) (GRase) [Parelaphostrongylus tenuis]